MSKQRFIWADSLKGWLMLLVILGHAIQSTLGTDCYSNHVWNLIYSFHMPAFMAVSGWLAYRSTNASKPEIVDWGGYINRTKRRAQQLLIPYFTWMIVSFLFRNEYTIQAVKEKILYPDNSLWFLWVLFWICALFNLAQLLANKLKQNEMVPILTTNLMLLIFMVAMEIRVLGFQFLAYYYLFYTLGYCLHKLDWKKLSLWRSLAPLALLWTILAWSWTMHGLPSWVPAIPHVPSTLLQYAYRGFTAFVAIVVLIGAAPKILNTESVCNDEIRKVGVVSLGLYAVHLSIMGLVVDIINKVFPQIGEWFCVALAFIIALTMSSLVVLLLSKNKYTARFFLGKI